MRRPTVLALTGALLVLANAAPAGSASDLHARNVEFLLGMIGARDITEPVTLTDGRTMMLAEAVDDAASRAGSIDLAAIAHGAVAPLGFHVGDIWILESGQGPCAITTGDAFTSPLPPLAPDPQLWIYSGWFGTMSTMHGHYTLTIGWTDKTSSFAFNTAGFSLWGLSDMYCIQGDGWHFAFPFLDGVAAVN